MYASVGMVGQSARGGGDTTWRQVGGEGGARDVRHANMTSDDGEDA